MICFAILKRTANQVGRLNTYYRFLQIDFKIDMTGQIISGCRRHPATVLGRTFKKHVTETELKFLLNMLDIMRKEYKYGIGQHGMSSLN